MERKEIALLDLIKIAYRWIFVLVAAMIIFAAAMFIYSENFVVPEYKADTKYCIQTRGQSVESNVLDSQRTVAYAQLVLGTYIDILDTRDFAEEVAFYMNGNVREEDSAQKQAALSDALSYVEGNGKTYTADGIESMLTFKSEEEKISFDISVNSKSYKEAFAVARCVETVASDYIEQKYPGVGLVTVIDKAIISDKPTNDRTLLLTLAGAVLGALLAFCVVYFVESTDKRIKDENAIQQKNGLAVIGVIPDMASEKLQK